MQLSNTGISASGTQSFSSFVPDFPFRQHHAHFTRRFWAEYSMPRWESDIILYSVQSIRTLFCDHIGRVSDFHPFHPAQGSCESMILRHRFKWCKASSMPHVGCARPAWVRVKSSMLKPSVNNLISRLTSAFPFPCLARSSSLFTNRSLERRLFLHVDRSALGPWLRIGSTLVRRNSPERMSVSQFFLYWQTSSQWPDRQLRNPTSVLPFEHVSELSICSLISSHPPRIPVKTGLQKSCVQSRACIERSDLWMARLLFTVLFCPQVRTKPQLQTCRKILFYETLRRRVFVPTSRIGRS